MFFPFNPTPAPDFLAFKELFVDYRLHVEGELGLGGGGGGGGGGHLAGLLAVSSISQVRARCRGNYGDIDISLLLFRLQTKTNTEKKRTHFYCEFIFLNIYKITLKVK